MRKILSGIKTAGKIIFTTINAGVLGLFLFSCSRAAPIIEYGFMSLVYYQDNERIRERFTFFIIPDDEDGIENLEELFLYHDGEQLRWHLKNDDWVIFAQDDKTWIGSRSLSMEGEETFPRGQYRAVLINKGGERTERNFTFDVPADKSLPFPDLEVSNGAFTVTSSYPNNYFVCYAGDGNYISTIRLPMLSGTLDDIGIPADVRMVALWAEDPLYFTSAFTESVNLR